MSNRGMMLVFVGAFRPARISQSGDCAHRIRRGKKVRVLAELRKFIEPEPEVRALPFGGKKRTAVFAEQRQSRGKEDGETKPSVSHLRQR